jgi:nicotinamidase-related amidase
MSSLQPPLQFARHLDFLPSGPVALVLVDCQRFFLDPTSPSCLPGAAAALRNARALLRHFERFQLPTVITRHAHQRRPRRGGAGSWWTRFLMEGEPWTELAAGITVPRGALLLRKDHYSAFRSTPLHRWLRERRVRALVLAGVMTHICVDSTARDAFMRGFDVLVAGDACASKHPLLHQASLLTLSHAVARVLPTRAVLRGMRGLA